MAKPEPDAGDVYEFEETVCGFAVTGREPMAVFQFVEAPLYHVAQSVDGHVDSLV